MGKERKQIRLLGETSDGALVMGGAFFFVESWGLPLTDVMEAFKTRGYVVATDEFIARAVTAGWKLQTAVSEVRDALGYVYGAEAVEAFNQWVTKEWPELEK